MTVAESETEVHVMIKRTGYLNHYAIVTCRSLSGDQQQQQVQFEPGESQKPCVVPLNSDDAFQGEREVNLELAEPTYAILGNTKSMLLIVNDPEDMPTISFLSDEIHINEEEKSLIIPIRKALLSKYRYYRFFTGIKTGLTQGHHGDCLADNDKNA